MRYCCAVLLSIFFLQDVFAQSVEIGDSIHKPIVSNMLPQKNDEMFVITDVVITGNKKTKGYIIIRETTFKKGDHIAASDKKIDRIKTTDL